MRTIIAGSREGVTMKDLEEALSRIHWRPSVVISGGARGADRLGVTWAVKNRVPYEMYHAQWALHGRAAGFIRNVDMAGAADALIAIWDGVSPGTRHMIKTARERELLVHVKLIERTPK